MGSGADVRSIAALRDWLAALVTYRSEASEALAGIQMEIRRGLDWVADQLDSWQRAIRDCEQEVAQAKVELSARKWQGFDGREPDTTLQERNLRRAEAKLEHALPRRLGELAGRIEALERYAEERADYSPRPGGAP